MAKWLEMSYNRPKFNWKEQLEPEVWECDTYDWTKDIYDDIIIDNYRDVVKYIGS